MHRTRTILICSAAVLTAGAAHAGVARVAPFESLRFESFDSGRWTFETEPQPVFGGLGTVLASKGRWTHITTKWSYAGHHAAEAFDGKQMLGSTGGSIVYAFDTAYTHFGGYFATISDAPGGTAAFYGADGALVAQSELSAVVGGDWFWNGWAVGEGFTRVEITSNHDDGAGGFLMHDAIRLSDTAVPGPGALALLGLSGLLVIRRTRRG